MIYIETDDDELCVEMLASYHERKTINVCGKDIAMSQISRNVLVSGGVSVEVKGGICITPAWSGEGLPPVGLVLEYMWNYKPEGSEYVQVEILVHDNGSAVMRALDGPSPGVLRESRGGYCGPDCGQPIFRLIRTPEQIEADKRKSEITFMASCIAHSCCRNAPTDNDIAAAAHLHYLGYRKP